MRRVLVTAVAVLAIVAMLAPSAGAQAPAPKVTINGLVDNVTHFNRNLSIFDLNLARKGDTEWYARTRVRPDITGELGTTKFVLGLEIDAVWGQVGGTDTVMTSGQRFGTTSGWDLNTDVVGSIEIKWAYTEFGFPGMPWSTRFRVGAQPWAATYKLGSLATGDFAGLHITAAPAPPVKFNFTYAQAEEASTGPRDGWFRGDDYAIVTSLEFTPFKGFDIRPIFSAFVAEGTTSGAARQNRGGVGNNAVVFPLNATEKRYTIGLDSRWRFGAFSLEPTVFYQWGTRELVQAGVMGEQDRSAWLIDVRGGFRAGPMLLELAGIYTSGNRAGQDVRNPRVKARFYEPISTDTSYYAGWAQHFALGIDYLGAMRESCSGCFTGTAIGYDKYGLIRVGGRASYAVVPAFTLNGAVTANWTAQEVDTDGTLANATGITPADFRGDSRYLGTELNLGFQWRFAPGVAFDVVGAYTFTGKALEQALITPGFGAPRSGRNPADVQSVVARVRYTF
jgi:hypothetical protein